MAGPHVHSQHTDAFYVIEGELTFEIGRESEALTVSSGGLVAVPPGVAHSFRNDSDRPARWLTIHAPDGGFAAFMRGVRDGVNVEWDIATVPAAAAFRPVGSDRQTRPHRAVRFCGRSSAVVPGSLADPVRDRALSAAAGSSPRTTRSKRQRLDACGSRVACEGLEEQLGTPVAALEEPLADGGQPCVRRDLDVVEADHRQLLGHVDPEVARRFEHAERLDVRGGEHGSRRIREPKQLARDAPRDVTALRSLPDVLGPDRDAG